ncbi:hypothetical protein MLD38_008888 [Melastoma candidum]|uniref:Uncharacterized protein n=1 Tax=Melastoma candidum TaxID=119954 RepID=A0ACB9S4C0_9MYRT|nr:hypothetical protein MLD38_008888 [Melastoma candidum]
MASEADTSGKSAKKPSQVCQVSSDNVGKRKELLSPVQNPIQEAQSPAGPGDGEEDMDVDDSISDLNYQSENENQQQKVAQRMLSWHMRYGQSEDTPAPSYDKEISHSPAHQCTGANVRVADPARDFGNVAWKERVDGWKMKQDKKNMVPRTTGQPASERGGGDIDASTDSLVDDSLLNDEARQPLSRKVSIPAIRYDREGEPSQLAAVDIFVSTVDPLKEPPLVTANTVLSILAVDYPVDKVSCYVSDDGAAMLTFEALSETSKFARKWVPFCKKHEIEPRAPEWYFAQKLTT